MSTSIIGLPASISESLEEIEAYLRGDELCHKELAINMLRSLRKSDNLKTPEGQYRSLKNLILAFGKCSINNGEMFSLEYESLRRKLFQASRPILKNLWKQMGREHHSTGKFELYEIGSRVRMIIGKTRIIDMYDKYIPVPDQNRLLSLDWCVESSGNTDISNMPEYTISNRYGQIVCRHEALKLLDCSA